MTALLAAGTPPSQLEATLQLPLPPKVHVALAARESVGAATTAAAQVVRMSRVRFFM
jgi:hypothetical protein